MRFHFSLAGLLRVRENMEKAEELLLNTIAHEIVTTRLDLERLELEQKALREKREEQLRRSSPAIHLQEVWLAELEVKQSCEELLLQLEKLEEQRQNQLAIFQQARQAHEIVSELREQQLQHHLRDELREEQKHLDDLFLSRRPRQK